MILSVATLLCPKLSRQLASSPQFATCSAYMQHVCSSQPAASLPFATCSKSADRKLHQVCSSQLAASLLTTCSRLDIINSEQAMRTHIIKSEQAMRTHPDIGLMIASCKKPAGDLLQLARFWLYISPSRILIFYQKNCEI